MQLPAIDYGLSDDEFKVWLSGEMKDAPGQQEYSSIFEQAIDAIIQWRRRYRGNPVLWKRIFKKERVIKELVEAVPIINEVQTFMDKQEQTSEKVTILDLCSGKGYLSMFLSEMLPADRVDKIILIDKAWPMCNSPLLPHHMNWDHIYANCTTCTNEEGQEEIENHPQQDNEHKTYFSTWPIRLHTSKQDLKKNGSQRQMKKHIFDKNPDQPVLVLAIHLCGTLSIKAVNMFNSNKNIKFLSLKPCCLPAMIHAERDEVFQFTTTGDGNDDNGNGGYSFEAKEVCSNGSFFKKEWTGPPRANLKGKFDSWSNHLYNGIQAEEILDGENVFEFNEGHGKGEGAKGKKEKRDIVIQVEGGFQNTYIFAGR